MADLLRGLRGFDAGIRRSIGPKARLGLGMPAGGIVNIVSSAKPLPSIGASMAGYLGKGLGAASVIPGIALQAQEVFNPTNNIVTSVQNLGTGIQNQFRSPQERQFYVGSDPVAVLGNRRISAQRGQANAPFSSAQGERPYGSTATLNGKPVVWAGKDYGWQSPITGSSTLSSLNSPGVQNRFIQDTGSSSSPAAERAYQAERSSVAQQAAQNPDLQRYQDQATLARQALQGYDPASGPLPGAAQQAQDMGMAMWAKANPGLAAKVRPGQSGFGAIQNTLASSAATAGLQMPSQLLSTPQIPGTTSFPTAIPQSGFQVPGAPAQDQLSSYPQFDPNKVDIGLFSKFMQANPKK
jgi:hypothetical protein